MKKMMKPVLSVLAASIALSACNLAPKNTMPSIDLPRVFKYDADGSEQAIQASSLGWEQYFSDPRLHQLIELALKNNTDLRLANLNVEQVRTQYAIQRNAQLPTINSSASAARGGNAAAVSNSYSVGLGVSSFELDLWGRVRNSSEAALQSYFATAASRDATHLSIVAAVAKAHFNEVYANESMVLAQRVLSSREETYRLSLLRHKAGVISAVDLREQEAAIEAARSAYVAAVRGREQARNALELLINQALPEDLPAPLPLLQQLPNRTLLAGLSSQVLLNRPDIRAAEYQLKQADANIGVARAAFFPTISLGSSIGLGHNELSNLFSSNNKQWSLNSGIGLPIFDWGSRKANLESVKIAREKAVVHYEATVKSAFRDVADALVVRAAMEHQLDASMAQRDAYNDRLRLIQLRYRHGVASSLNLLDAERSSFSAESNVLSTELVMLENLADLYKALGGGLKRLVDDEAVILEQIEQAPAMIQAAQEQATSETQIQEVNLEVEESQEPVIEIEENALAEDSIEETKEIFEKSDEMIEIENQ